MPKSDNQNKRLHQFKKLELDSVSKSFCAAKWLNATLWLNLGKTASCHHPLAHNISSDEIAVAPHKLHNTEVKVQARQQMLKGERPAECDYCWRVEDQGPQLISDRVFKSEIYSHQDLKSLVDTKNISSVLPQTLELSFSNKCNFACFYCNPNVSSRWEAEMQALGPFHMIRTGWQRFGYKSIQISPEQNPYTKAFWSWWPELKESLKEIRVTGGEPLLAEDTWKLLSRMQQEPMPNCRVAINSNLGVPKPLLERLYEAIKHIPNFHIYTSAESVGKLAEAVRDGINYESWRQQIEVFGNHPKLVSLNVMATINAVTVQGFAEFLREFIQMKKTCRVPLALSVNVLRYPAFQNIWILPLSLRQIYASEIDKVLSNAARDAFSDSELESILRLSASLKLKAPTFSDEFKKVEAHEYQMDLKNYILQYSHRRKMNLDDFLRPDFLQWLESFT